MIANVALPSFLPHSFATLIGILVIAAIEGWFLKRALDLSFAESYRHTLYANWSSTVAGIPLAWLLWMLGLLPVTMGLSAMGFEAHPVVESAAIQTIMYGGIMPTEWTYVGKAIASIIMLIPFWMGSVWIERRTIKRGLEERAGISGLSKQDTLQISRAVVRGNLASYSLFLILSFHALSSAMTDLPEQKARFQERQEKLERLKQERKEAEEKTSPDKMP